MATRPPVLFDPKACIHVHCFFATDRLAWCGVVWRGMVWRCGVQRGGQPWLCVFVLLVLVYLACYCGRTTQLMIWGWSASLFPRPGSSRRAAPSPVLLRSIISDQTYIPHRASPETRLEGFAV